jgi:acyl-CoA reductase-like NAD-dependent aldehyde dehydrogenase
VSNLNALVSYDALYVAGRWTKDAARQWLDVTSPATEETIGRIPLATTTDVDYAVGSAVAAHREGFWRRLPITERAKHLIAVAEGIERRSADFDSMYILDQGGLASFASVITVMGADLFRATASFADQIDLGPTRRNTMNESVLISREPVGPVAAIVPWNSPLGLGAVKIASALLAGCPVVVKFDPVAPMVAFLLADVFEEMGFPEGLVSFLPGGRELGQHLISRPGIRSISFTGSTAAGRQVMTTAAETMARVTLELGGKSAALVLDDADPAVFAPQLAFGSTIQTGQVCTTQSRIFVPESRRQEWVDALTGAFSALVVGDPADPGTAIGPLASQAQLDRTETFVHVAREEGATILTGGSRPQGEQFERGYWYLPTLITDTRPDMQINREEVFGPVITVETYDGLEAGIEAANSTEFGLSNGIYTPDIEKAVTIAPLLESGVVAINFFGPSATAPYGGTKMSGMGREGGVEGVEEFLEIKQVNLPRS